MSEQKDPRRKVKPSDGLVKIGEYKNKDPIYDYSDKSLRDPPLDWWAWPLALAFLAIAIAIVVTA